MVSAQIHRILDTDVTMPVEIRHARCFVAGFTASATAISRAIGRDTGPGPTLRPLRLWGDRGMCMLVFVEYLDGDLGPYHEFGVVFLVEDPATEPGRGIRARLATLRSLFAGNAHALIHRLPVDGEFTRAAGREIWGFPKVIADFAVDHTSTTKSGRVSQDGSLIAELTVARGIGVPDAGDDGAVLQSYSDLDGVLRRTPWRLTGTAETRTRLGGARLRLGDHPMAEELRGLGLSRRAVTTSSVGRLSMLFDDATELT